jgi:hypothetical protein
MSDFKPTYLYIKQHTSTGLKYFGKTINDPLKYHGSGLYWKRHLKAYGNNVSTIWTQLFTDREQLTEYAIKFSQDNDIVKSKDWANCRIEDGLMGGDTGISTEGRKILSEKSKRFRHSEGSKQKIRETRKKQTNLRTGQKHSQETIEKIKAKRALQIVSDDTKKKISESLAKHYAKEQTK